MLTVTGLNPREQLPALPSASGMPEGRAKLLQVKERSPHPAMGLHPGPRGGWEASVVGTEVCQCCCGLRSCWRYQPSSSSEGDSDLAEASQRQWQEAPLPTRAGGVRKEVMTQSLGLQTLPTEVNVKC